MSPSDGVVAVEIVGTWAVDEGSEGTYRDRIAISRPQVPREITFIIAILISKKLLPS